MLTSNLQSHGEHFCFVQNGEWSMRKKKPGIWQRKPQWGPEVAVWLSEGQKWRCGSVRAGVAVWLSEGWKRRCGSVRAGVAVWLSEGRKRRCGSVRAGNGGVAWARPQSREHEHWQKEAKKSLQEILDHMFQWFVNFCYIFCSLPKAKQLWIFFFFF